MILKNISIINFKNIKSANLELSPKINCLIGHNGMGMRDGQQSLFATRMKQENVDKLLPLYQEAKFYIMEVWGGAVPDSVMRYLGESPWDRLRSCSKAMKGISLLSALSRGRNLFGYVPYPESVLEGFYKEAIKNGLNIMRIFDALNDIDNIKSSIRLINELGGIADAAVCYTVDPKGADEKIFTDEYFVNKAKEMESIGAKMITLKDMAGLVNPARIHSLMPKLKEALSVPVDFHTHCTPGYGLASVLTAIIQNWIINLPIAIVSMVLVIFIVRKVYKPKEL